jgi:hypothetical protein
MRLGCRGGDALMKALPKLRYARRRPQLLGIIPDGDMPKYPRCSLRRNRLTLQAIVDEPAPTGNVMHKG